MITFSYTAPYGAGINFLGMKASVVALAEFSASSIQAQLDYSKTISGNRLIVQCRDGTFTSPSTLLQVYNQAQFFYTPALNAGNLVLGPDSILDDLGNEVKPEFRKSMTVGFEVQVGETSAPNPIWACWIAEKIGTVRIDLRTNKKLLKTLTIRVQERPKAELDGIRNGNPISVNSITAPFPKTIYAGNLIALPVKISDVTDIRSLELRAA